NGDCVKTEAETRGESWRRLIGLGDVQANVSAMGIFTGTSPMQFQRTMIFVDGTNPFYRLGAANLVVEHLAAIFHAFSFVSGGRQIIRIYLYTIQEHLDRALERHGSKFTNDVRVVLGYGIPTKDGKHQRESRRCTSGCRPDLSCRVPQL